MRLIEAKYIINNINESIELNEFTGIIRGARALAKTARLVTRNPRAFRRASRAVSQTKALQRPKLGMIDRAFGIASLADVAGTGASSLYNAYKGAPPTLGQKLTGGLATGANVIRNNPRSAALVAGGVAAGAAGLTLAARRFAEQKRRKKCAEIDDPDARNACLNNK